LKRFLALLWTTCSMTVFGAAQAAAPSTTPYAPYDDFNARLLNPAKWSGGETDDARVNLENLRYIHGNSLRLYSRGSAATKSSLGTRYGSNSLRFRNPNSITAIKASVQAKSATLTKCPANSNVSLVRARLGGTFFNAGPRISGDNTNDVLAQIRLERTSTSTDAPNVVRVRYKVSLCLDSNCFNASDLKSGEIGPPVKFGQKVALSLEWDKTTKRFIFRRDGLEAVVNYTVSDASTPGASFKQLQVGHYVANCTSTTAPTAAMDAYFDDVYTNPLSASSAKSTEMEEIDPRDLIYGESVEAAGL